MRVLIVDDEEEVRRVLRRLVETEGHTVIEASSAEEAVELAAQQDTLPVALCDVYLPGHDGLWLASELAATHPETAVVITTGAQDFQIVVTGLHAGIVDYLVKPFSRPQLSAALQRGVLVHASRRAHIEMERDLREQQAQIAAAVVELQQSASYFAMATEIVAREHGKSLASVLG